MRFSTSLLRNAALLAAFALVAGIWSATAAAQTVQYPVTGNARYQIGNGLPIPIGLSPVPHGRVKVQPGATVQQTTGPDPKKMILPPSGATAPGNPVVVGLFRANQSLLQVGTAIPLAGPKTTAIFSAGGRTGPTTVSWCPGQAVLIPPTTPTTSTNPGCVSAGAGPGINGRVVFTATRNQFGGVNQGNVGGTANIAINAGGATTLPGVVTASFAIANPFATGAQGGPFGFVGITAGALPTGIGSAQFNAGVNGTLLGSPIQTFNGLGALNPAITYGVPWTTGSLFVSVTQNIGPQPEKFLLRGRDQRINGIGAISLVTGGVSNRGISGPNGNRGWLNLQVGAPIMITGPVSALSKGGLAAVFGLLALAGGYVLHRKAR